MKTVYILGKREINANPFFNGIMDRSKYQFEYLSLHESLPKGTILLIQWPEKIFDWRNPDDDEIEFLRHKLTKWNTNNKIVYQVHNLKRHYGMEGNFQSLYNLIYRYAHIFVHFGKYSQEFLSKKYPLKIHEYIPHPLYEKPFKFFPKSEARIKLGIPQDALVVAVPGKIRHEEERRLILNAFKNFSIKKERFLLIPFMKYKNSQLEFPGRIRLKRIIDIKKIHERILNKKNKKRIQFGFSPVSFEELSNVMSASDMIIIPRLDVLNSGNIFLGLSYNKIIIGPRIGNLVEFLDKFDMPSFDPTKKNDIKRSIRKAEGMLKNGFTSDKILLEELDSNRISKRWDEIFSSGSNF